jgi:hypothetical protein
MTQSRFQRRLIAAVGGPMADGQATQPTGRSLAPGRVFTAALSNRIDPEEWMCKDS